MMGRPKLAERELRQHHDGGNGITEHLPTSVYALEDQVRTFVQERPYAAVLLAAAAGYSLARLATWR